MDGGGGVAPGTRLGRWRLDALLGEGATARVWSARHVEVSRRAAVKVLRGAFDDDPVARQRFAREAEVAARVRHPGVVPLFDAGVEDGTAYVVMDLVEGEDLATRIAREGPMEPLRAAALGRDIADALAAVHGLGVLHRDVKPANVLLTRDAQGRERPVLVDFGAAFLLRAQPGDAPLTLRGELVGTPAYMAPEMAEGSAVDERADVYALGVLLYECLTGRRPFDAPTWQATLLAVSRGRHPSLRSLRPEAPRVLEAIVTRAMRRDPAARFPTAAAIRDALDGFIAAPEARTRKIPTAVAALAVTGAIALAGIDARRARPPARTATATPAVITATMGPQTAAAMPEQVTAVARAETPAASDAGAPTTVRGARVRRGTGGALILPRRRVVR